MGQAISLLMRTLGREGRGSLRSAGYAAKRTLSIDLTERNVWGVRFPEVHYVPVIRALDARGYTPPGVSAHGSSTARQFEPVLDLILHSVSVELRLKKLGAEIKKATRRINALNEVMIPTLAREVKIIRQTLEEREREDMFRIR